VLRKDLYFKNTTQLHTVTTISQH